MLSKFLALNSNKQFNIAFLLGVSFLTAIIILNGIYTLLLFHIGVYETKTLNLNEFEQNTIEVIDSNTFITASADSYLIYGEENKKIANVQVECEFSQVYGEFVCFYAQTKTRFNAKDCVQGVPVEENLYL